MIAYVFTEVFMFIFHFICSALSCRLSAQFCPQLPHGCFACCCLNMSFILIPLLKPKTLPTVCADLVNPWISKNISAYFWRCDVLWDLREIAYYSCYHTPEQRLFCTSDCWWKNFSQPMYRHYESGGQSLYRSDDMQALCETHAPHLFYILISKIVSADRHVTSERHSHLQQQIK